MANSGVAIRTSLIAGALSGLAAGLLFALLHAFIIVPIWDRMFGGLLFGVLAGAVGGWTYAELYPDQPDGAWRAAARGASFGAALWIAVIPVTAADVVLRWTGVAARSEYVAVAVAVLLALAGGCLLGWYRTRRRRGMVAGAAATLFLTFAMAGPVPIANSARALGIYVAVLPASLLGGAILGVVIFVALRRNHGAPTTHPSS